jgi:glyoxylate utilization-related uncharacterized protein
MQSLLHTLDRPAPVLHTTPVLNQNGFSCALLTLAPGTETELPPSHTPDDQLLYVVDGEVAVLARGVTTLLQRGKAMLLPPGKSTELAARAAAPVRLLRIEIPPRQIVSPEIIAPDN